MGEPTVTVPIGDPEWVDRFLNAWGALAEAVLEFGELAESTSLSHIGLMTAGLKAASDALERIEEAVTKHNLTVA